MPSPPLADLALVGDRRTAALVTSLGSVVWYGPGRFDAPTLFASLVGPERGGAWAVEAPGARSAGRRYVGDTAVLETLIASAGGVLVVTDWMPLGEGLPCGLVRQFSEAPADWRAVLTPAPDYGRRAARAEPVESGALRVDDRHTLWGSHPLAHDGDRITMDVPAGGAAWMALLDDPAPNAPPDADALRAWRETTETAWQTIAGRARYHGPYEGAVAASLRALRLLTYAETGAVVAAPTAGLPEVVGGERNYDYRYAWLRDAGMVVSALTRVGSDGTDERKLLAFLSDAPQDGDLPLAPFSTVDGGEPPEERALDLGGWRGSRPVHVGNGARGQRQLDGYANVLFAAKLLYERFGTREHWPLVCRLADFLADHWREPDYGIWEEREPRQYTTSKVVSAVSLEFVAAHAEAEDAARWRGTAREIRQYVAEHCLTAEGAYAAEPGGTAVDVSAALFPVWAYCDADTPEMVATIEAIERDLRAGPRPLYRRHLVQVDARGEGAFLAGTLWVAQYWVMRSPDRAREVLDAVVALSSDLGYLSEEADPATRQLLGNVPQTFVHAALIGAVHDYAEAVGR